MRRTLIQLVLPTAFCLVPVVLAMAIFAAIPAEAQSDYVQRVRSSAIDWLILGLGFGLFIVQSMLSYRALQWHGKSFDERPDRWLSHLAQAAEWFPLLGLIGTVAAILQTFNSVTPDVKPPEIIKKYAPAITATGSGLFMALINILPTWMVLVGRDLIRSLAGGPPPPPEGNPS